MPLDEDRLAELVNLTADGQATPHQQEELQLMLDRSPDARQVETATRRIVARLDSIEPVNPPPELRPSVMDRVRDFGDKRVQHPSSSRRRTFTFAWAAAAALVIVVFLAYRPGRIEDEAGAVMAPAAGWPVVATLQSEGDSVVIRRQGDVYAVEPRISGPYPVTVSLSWDPTLAAMVGLSGGPEAVSSSQQAEFTLRSAEDRPSVMVRRLGEDPFEIRVAVAGTEIARAEMPVD
jgi:hypothetical protein